MNNSEMFTYFLFIIIVVFRFEKLFLKSLNTYNLISTNLIEYYIYIYFLFIIYVLFL